MKKRTRRVASRLKTYAVLFWGVSLLARPAVATDRYYPDIEAFSPDKHWRVTAVSPDNEKKKDGRTPPFAKDFTYTLFDERHNATIWSRAQQSEEASPVAIFPSDQGWVVVRTGWDQLVVLDPADGNSRLTVNIIEQFTKAERRRYVHETTAGPMWSQRSCWRFVRYEDRELFVIRTWWDRRIVVDLSASTLLQDEEPLRTVLDIADQHWIMATLEAARAAGPPANMGCCDLPGWFWDTLTATHMAGRMGITKAASALRELEKWEYIGSIGGWRYGDMLKPGQIDPSGVTSFSLRRIAQLALRRLGEKPAYLAPLQFRRHEKKGNETVVAVSSPVPDRDQAVEQVREGMSPDNVLNVLGAPDFAGRRNRSKSVIDEVWEYDMDAADPYTLRIVWNQKKIIVQSTERVSPPLWQTDTRDEDID